MRLSGYSLVLMTAIVSGFSVFINKFGVSESDPFLYTALKNGLVAVFLVSIILLLRDWDYVRNLKRDFILKLAAIGIIGGGVPFLLFFYGLSITTAAKAAFMHKTMFVFVGLLAFFFLGERLNRKQIIAAGALLFGTFLLLGAPSFDTGCLFVLAATVLWAAENTLSKHVLKDVKASVVALGRMGFGSLVILGFLAFTGRLEIFATLGTTQLAWALLSSAFLLVYVWTWYHGLAKIKATEATAILIIGSAITTILSYVVTPSLAPDKIAGILLIFASTAALVWCSGKSEITIPSSEAQPCNQKK
jgi:drug/metabolite transporter (DMT)-like permease